jgi:hypothetical protein
MSRWNAKTSTLILLGSVVFVVLLLVVLPDVDPPDTAFHRGTAPVVVHSQANAAPLVTVVAPVFELPNTDGHDWALLRLTPSLMLSPPNFGPILLCSFRC